MRIYEFTKTFEMSIYKKVEKHFNNRIVVVILGG